MGIRRVTSQDVAKRAGVSRTTVSFVLNHVAGTQISEETRQRVLQAAEELGYVPDAAAQALASGRTKTIGLLLARRPSVIASDLFLTQILEVLVREINRQGMRLLLEVAEDVENREAYLRLVRSNRIDGILYSGPRLDDAALSALVAHGVPTVIMGMLPNPGVDWVDVNNRAAARSAVDHLIHLGHARIACLTNASLVYSAALERLQGYQDALAGAGLPGDSALVRHADFDPQSGYEQMSRLLNERQDFTAAFVASDTVAFGAMAAIREHGLRIPQDIALVGFDDVPVARFVEPSLTTVRLPVLDLARAAAEMIIDRVRGERRAPRQKLLDATLVVRRSCGEK